MVSKTEATQKLDKLEADELDPLRLFYVSGLLTPPLHEPGEW
jgi:hypothetical protein